MKTTHKQNLLAAALGCALAFTTTIARAADPLPSWNDGKSKQSIIAFVMKVTTPGSPDFVPNAERIATWDDPIIDPALISYVSAFVPKGTGEHFNPHVTTGVAPKTYLDQMLAAPFASFTFSPAGAAVYQLGQFGTAAKKLKQLALKP